MKKTIVYSIVLLIFSLYSGYSQSVLGKWKTIDDLTGEAKSILEIYEKAGKIYGRVIEILDPNHKKEVCTKCDGENKNKSIVGMTIINGLKKDGNEYNSGEILDPKTGKTYKCVLLLESKDKLKVRGYLGIPLIGRTQYWLRVK